MRPVTSTRLMQDGAVEGGVAARPDGQMQIGGAGDRREARVNDDQPGSKVARLPDPVRERREGFADIGAANHDDFGVSQVGIIVR